MKEKKLNIEYIRVFAIFLTIMIHVSNIYRREFLEISNFDYFVSLIYNSISRICVPLFFMVSGMLLINAEFNFKKYYKRILKFVLILIFWSLVYYFVNNYMDISGTFSKFVVNSFFNANMSSKHLWFMYAIIALYISLPFIQNMCKNMTYEQENLFIILWGVFSGFSFLYLPFAEEFLGHNVNISYPVPIINGAYYLGYFIMGNILYKRFKNVKLTKKTNIFCILLYCFSVLTIVLITFVCSIIHNMPYDYTLWYRGVFAIIATCAVFVLFIGNEGIFNNKNILKLSKFSFGIYLIHILFLKILNSHLDITIYSPIIFIPLITLGIYIVSLLACFVIKKIPLIKNII